MVANENILVSERARRSLYSPLLQVRERGPPAWNEVQDQNYPRILGVLKRGNNLDANTDQARSPER